MFHPRPAPVRDRLLHLLRQANPDAGLCSAELAVRMGRSTASVNGYLCKMAAYGWVRKIPEQHRGSPCPQELNRWKLP
jgi:DNA-binding IclR family transcriptional regulator